jgi:hypothetical protein
MLGYDISWAAFNIIEVMSSSKFTFKVELNVLFTRRDGNNEYWGSCSSKSKVVIKFIRSAPEPFF